jgi:hypothetical protein
MAHSGIKIWEGYRGKGHGDWTHSRRNYELRIGRVLDKRDGVVYCGVYSKWAGLRGDKTMKIFRMWCIRRGLDDLDSSNWLYRIQHAAEHRHLAKLVKLLT